MDWTAHKMEVEYIGVREGRRHHYHNRGPRCLRRDDLRPQDRIRQQLFR
jgi:hypothetical protein